DLTIGRSRPAVLPLHGLGLDALNVTHLLLVQNALGILGVDSKRIRPHHSTTGSFFLDLSFHVNQGCLTSYRHEMSSRKDVIPSRGAASCLGYLLRIEHGVYQYTTARAH